MAKVPLSNEEVLARINNSQGAPVVGPRSPTQMSEFGTNLGFAPVNPRGAGYAPATLQQPRSQMSPMMRQAFNLSGVQTPWQFNQAQQQAEAARQARNPAPTPPAPGQPGDTTYNKEGYDAWMAELLKWYYGNNGSLPNFGNLGNLGFPGGGTGFVPQQAIPDHLKGPINTNPM